MTVRLFAGERVIVMATRPASEWKPGTVPEFTSLYGVGTGYPIKYHSGAACLIRVEHLQRTLRDNKLNRVNCIVRITQTFPRGRHE